MYVNPVQQTPLAYDPARQIVTPPAPVDPLPQQQPTTQPVLRGDTPQDKFGPHDGGGGNQQEGGTSESQKAANAQQLHYAWVRLQELKQLANQALLAGDARGARDAAEEAAQVAVQIQNITGSTPDDALGPIEVAAQQIASHNATQVQQASTGTGEHGGSGQGAADGSVPAGGQASDPGSSPGNAGVADVRPGTVIDIARSGLGTANDVVDTAASVPQPALDLASIQGFKQTVLRAIAGVEAIAARVLGHSAVSSAAPGRIDIRA